jgi:hypothetical protein
MICYGRANESHELGTFSIRKTIFLTGKMIELVSDTISYIIFILGFCILLRVLYQGYQKNRPSQQLFKAFIVFILRPYTSTAVEV